MLNCNPETGACELPSLQTRSAVVPKADELGATVHYVGDPMCSWCWGLSQELKLIAKHCLAQGMGFTMTMGGLRAGGGDAWNDQFKAFLRREWRHIAAVTGQPIGEAVLELAHFEYDTEPACRAVAVAQQLLEEAGKGPMTWLGFFSAVQRKFYVEGADPKEVEFYRSLCEDFRIPFADFQQRFQSGVGDEVVREHFRRCRAMGVRSFPTLLVQRGNQLFPVAAGFVKSQDGIARIGQLLAPR